MICLILSFIQYTSMYNFQYTTQLEATKREFESPKKYIVHLELEGVFVDWTENWMLLNIWVRFYYLDSNPEQFMKVNINTYIPCSAHTNTLWRFIDIHRGYNKASCGVQLAINLYTCYAQRERPHKILWNLHSMLWDTVRVWKYSSKM